MLANSSNLLQVHVVQYDGQGKISQIRLYWDQATMLRQVEAIGKSGRNWPIRDGAAQIKTVKNSINNTASASTSLPLRSAGGNDFGSSDRSSQPRDFHARLFATNENAEPRSPSNVAPGYAPRTSAKPAPRQLDEIFTGEDYRGEYKPEGKPKIGSSKNFSDNRLFEENTELEKVLSPESKKIYPDRYDHFEFGQADNRPLPAKAHKQTHQLDFKDIVTPEKHRSKPNPEQERHIGPGKDEVSLSTSAS